MRRSARASTRSDHRAGPLMPVLLLGALLIPVVPLEAGQLECGQLVTESTTLEEDLLCEGVPALLIGAAGITVDLNGHTIAGHDSMTGIENRGGYDDVTIRNGTIRNFRIGIRLENVSGSVIENIALQQQAETAILLRGSSANAVRRNVVDKCATAAISLRFSSDDNVVESNTLTNVGSGVSVNTASSRNLITRNNVSDSGRGIVIASDENEITRNVVHSVNLDGIGVVNADHNLIRGNATTDSYYGIMLATDTTSNRVVRNLIDRNDVGVMAFGQEGWPGNRLNVIHGNSIVNSRRAGILVQSYATETQISHNRLVSNRLGIQIGTHDAGPDGTLLFGNKVIGSSTHGIEVGPHATETQLVSNRADRNGSTAGAWNGIDVAAPGTVLIENTAFFNSGFGIAACPGVIDGGGNKAKHNDAGQCVNLVCK